MRQFFRSEGVDKWCETEIKMILEGERERERREGEREYLRKIYTIILNIYILVLNTLIIEIYLELLDHTIYLYLH